MAGIGKVISWCGVAVVVCGVLYVVAYYLTSGFLDVDALSPLQDLGYGNLAVGGAFLCFGVTVFGIGALFKLVGRQR